MAYNKSELGNYRELKADIIPIHPWNKKIKGKERGKTPVHSDWTKRTYKSKSYKDWINKGYNLGYRIREEEVVVDLDPRNYEGQDCSQKVAELFGYFDIDELIEHMPVVLTGGGGYHIYCLLPEGTNYREFKEVVEEELPGVEFKRKGRQVLCAGSKHPSGNFYKWLNWTQPKIIPTEVSELFERELVNRDKDYSDGRGVLNGAQLTDIVLDKLDPCDFDTNDAWWPIMCGSHHATDGQGVDEFVEWSMQDDKYSEDENTIRGRWESLSEKANSITIGSLIHHLEKSGEDTSDLKAVLSFSNMSDLNDFDDFDDMTDEEKEDADILKQAIQSGDEIDISDIYDIPDEEEVGVEGAAIAAARALRKGSPNDEILKCLRLIKAATTIETMQSSKIVVENTSLSLSDVKGLLKQLDAKIIDDLGLLVSQKTLEKSFNKGRHLTNPPNGSLWAYKKTHWSPMSDEFLAKLIQKTLHVIKKKMTIEMNEVALLSQSVKLTRIESSTLTDRIHRTSAPLSVVNCKNGELWMTEEGGHELKPHNYRSYLLNCLNVDYDPSAECPLFMETLHDIFRDYPDTEDMVRHMGEILGYTIQPHKNIASWWLFRGPGGDGKSTILKILSGILGDAQLSSTSKILACGSEFGNNHALHSLVGKLAVTIEELPANYLLKDEGMKMLSENTKMEANPKLKDAFSFMYSATLIMCSNGYPAVRDLSEGMIRRANIIPFNRSFHKKQEDDLDRPNKILKNPKEMAGVLNFMLNGLQRLRDRGRFKVPVSCQTALETWRGESNNMIMFLKQTIVITRNHNENLCDFKEFYHITYDNWCVENGIDPKMIKKMGQFKKDLVSLGLQIRTGSGNILKIYGGQFIKVDTLADELDEEFDLDW